FDPELEDQTWCLYDRQLVDDELPYIWKEFDPGVNIFVLLDSCHSGTAIKELSFDLLPEMGNWGKTKDMPIEKTLAVFLNNRQQYAPILKDFPSLDLDTIGANVLLISACQDNEKALAGSFTSFFTKLVLLTLEGARSKFANYDSFYEFLKSESFDAIKVSPNKDSIGKDLSYFENNLPFLRPNTDYPVETNNLYRNLILGGISPSANAKPSPGLIVDLENPDDQVQLPTQPQQATEELGSKSLLFLPEDATQKSLTHPWDEAYDYYDQLVAKGVHGYVEPAELLSPPLEEPILGSKGANDYLETWPDPEGYENEFTWYLDAPFSQLAQAREKVMSEIPADKQEINIGIIDTGYVPGHPALPANLQTGKNFIPGEEGQPPHDILENRKFRSLEQDFHGTATMAILAAGEIPEELAYGQGDRRMGAIPFANVHPIRVSDTVVYLQGFKNVKPFVKAVEWAIKEGIEVISMSMGGAPIRAWAKVIDRAYEAGITIVSAAGNSWVKGWKRILPKKIVYPARLDRVIGATGVCFNQHPYVFHANPGSPLSKAAGGTYMQGSIPTRAARKSCLAAYTPNIPWTEFVDERPSIRKDGGGTSSATPQIAAAAALWLVYNRAALQKKGYAGTWKQVEAVRYALFQSANKEHTSYETYFGNGILKAHDALQIDVPDEHLLKKAKRSRISPLGVVEVVSMLFLRKSDDDSVSPQPQDKLKAEMLMQEVAQIIELDPQMTDLC
ncbi:MAG: S8 family serine peptidase, partial [Bacteroidota bacterium]